MRKTDEQIQMEVLIFVSLCVMGAFGRPEGGYGQFDHQHGYNPVPVVPKIVDYYSKPQYAFGYEVDDYYQQLSHGRWEIRDGDVTQGQYRVLLPDGRIQIVSYIADKGGYRPTIQYIGKGAHPPPPPAYAHIKPPKHLHVEPDFPQNDIYDQGPVPVLTAAKPIVPIVPIGPLKLDVGQIGPTGYGGYGNAHAHQHSHGHGHQGYGADPYGAYGALGHQGYGQAYGYGYGGDALGFAGSNQKTVKISPGRLAKKRALLYDRTLFRRDIPKPLNHRD